MLRKKVIEIFPLALLAMLLLFFTTVAQAEAMKLRVITSANVRLKPTTDSPVIATLPAGALLESTGKFGSWFQVDLPPDERGIILIGYIWEELVEAVVGTPAPQPQTPRATTPPPPPPTTTPQPPAYQPPQPAYQRTSGSGLSFGLKLSGGMTYLSMSDPNAALQSWTDVLELMANAIPGVSMSGQIGPLHWGMNFEGDVIILVKDTFGIGIGAGYITGKNGANDTVSLTDGVVTETITALTTVSAIPLRLGLYYFLSVSPSASVFINAGGGYYLARWSQVLRDEYPGNWSSLDQEATAGGIGFHGGLGVMINLTQNIALTIEGQGRYAKIAGFEGTADSDSSSGWSDSWEGPLYYYEEQGPTSTWYPFISIEDVEPGGAGIRNVREAAIDFTGFAARIGIIIRF